MVLTKNYDYVWKDFLVLTCWNSENSNRKLKKCKPWILTNLSKKKIFSDSEKKIVIAKSCICGFRPAAISNNLRCSFARDTIRKSRVRIRITVQKWLKKNSKIKTRNINAKEKKKIVEKKKKTAPQTRSILLKI